MATELDYSTLSLLDALDLAILIEEDARERYQEFAEQLAQHNNRDAAAFFSHMNEQENKHGEELRTRRWQLFADAAVRVNPDQIPMSETCDYDAASVFMSPHQALRVALANETRAHDFYAAVLGRVSDPQVKKLFAELKREEMQHQSMVRSRLRDLPPEDKNNPDDFADEPVGH